MTTLPVIGATPGGCSLSAEGLATQRDRVRTLRPSVVGIERTPDALSIRFAAGTDPATLRELVETERQCCSFLAIAYDEPGGTLDLAVRERERRDVLDLFERAFTEPAGKAGS